MDKTPLPHSSRNTLLKAIKPSTHRIKIRTLLPLLLILLSIPCYSQGDSSVVQPAKPRLLVLTDIGGDPDDQQSLVRLLTYANEFHIEGLLATSRLAHGYDTRPEQIEILIKAYALVYDSLRHHADGYPRPDSLQTRVKSGLGDPSKLGAGWDTQASRWIIEVAQRPDDHPLWISIWGGSRELAQALWSVRDRCDDEALNAFIKKIRVFAVADQDRWGYWINKSFPELFYIYAGSCGHRSCQSFRGQYLTGDTSMQNRLWIDANVRKDHGPLGALYPRNGGGVSGMKEGDTPAFLFAYNNGLMNPEYPQWGGWGGRFDKDREGYFVDAADLLDGSSDERHTVSRWRPFFQNEFAARMDWCRTANRDSANHPPLAVVNHLPGTAPIYLQAQPDRTILLDARASLDPDGHRLTAHWWFYRQASSYQGPLALADADSLCCRVTMPAAAAGKSIHLILQVTDSGVPPLTAFRRIILSQ